MQLLAEDAQEREDCVVRTADLDNGGYPRAIVEREAWRQGLEGAAPFGIAFEHRLDR